MYSKMNTEVKKRRLKQLLASGLTNCCICSDFCLHEDNIDFTVLLTNRRPVVKYVYESQNLPKPA